jgi:uncharacterized protein (TIGR00251 family)
MLSNGSTAMVLPDVPYLRADKFGAVTIDVQVVPNASRTQADGIHDGALRLRLQAQPVEGKANLALIRWLAVTLAIPRAHIELLRGAGARRKQLRVSAEKSASAQWQALLPRS